jgi:hypothetical protein
MSPLLRRRARTPEGVAPRRPHPGVLRRERRALLKAREDLLGELGGLTLEMYRRGGFRDDLLAERCATLVGIDVRLSEIDNDLHGRSDVPRCTCGAAVLRGAHFCPNCGRSLQPTEADAGAGDR